MHVVVPHDSLKPETLRAVIEEFLTRDGAVHGHSDTPLDRRVEAVRRMLASREAVLVFDDESQACTIRTAAEMRRGAEAKRGATPERRIEPINE